MTKTMDYDFEVDGEARRWLALAPVPGAETHITLSLPVDGSEHEGGFTGIVLTAADVDEAYEQMVARGVTFVQPLEVTSWRAKQAIFLDSEDNMLALHE